MQEREASVYHKTVHFLQFSALYLLQTCLIFIAGKVLKWMHKMDKISVLAFFLSGIRYLFSDINI